MKEVAPGIFMVTETENGRFVKFSVNLFIIADEEGLVFDAGYGRKKAVSQLAESIAKAESIMAERGRPCSIGKILPSHGHWDHFSGIPGLRQKTGIRVLATERMLQSITSKKKYRRSFRRETGIINVPVSRLRKKSFSIFHRLIDEIYLRVFGVRFVGHADEIINEETILDTGTRKWEVKRLPGHCDDAVVLYERESGILLAGDNILRSVTTWLGPPRSNLADYMETLDEMLNLPGLKLILPSHGSPITEPQKRITEAIAHRKKRTEDVYECIRSEGPSGATFDNLLTHFYPKVSFSEKMIVRGWILTTLEYLLQNDSISATTEANKKVFRAKS